MKQLRKWVRLVSFGVVLFIALVEGLTLYAMGLDMRVLREKAQLLSDHKRLCKKYVQLAEAQVAGSKRTQAGYSRLVQNLLNRLGVAAVVPGIDEEVARAIDAENVLGHETEVPSTLQGLQVAKQQAQRSGTGGSPP